MEDAFHTHMRKAFFAQKNQIRPYMSSLGLSPGQPKILSYLYAHSPCLQRELAEGCEIEPATVSKILNNMEESNLIERKAVPNDRRAVSVTLTDRGRESLKKTEIFFEKVNALSLQGFTEEEKVNFTCYLKRMYENLTKGN